MTKEQLEEMGLTEEQVEQVWNGITEGFVTKSRFNEVNGELKTAKETIKERDEQLETLQNSNGDVETLKNDIKKLQDDNKKQAENHAKEIIELKINTAIDKALVEAKAINSKAVKALLDLEDAKLNEDGTIVGLAEQLKTLKEAEDSKMLFSVSEDKDKSKIKGFKPSENKDGLPPTPAEKNPFEKGENYDPKEQLKLFKENPELARELAEKAGVKLGRN